MRERDTRSKFLEYAEQQIALMDAQRAQMLRRHEQHGKEAYPLPATFKASVVPDTLREMVEGKRGAR